MYDPALTELLRGTEQRQALLDTNLVMLWISAKLGEETLAIFKRVKAFAWNDVLLLEWMVSRFAGVVTTSYVLAEVSNLANELTGTLRDRWFYELSRFAVATEEAHVETKVVGAQEELIRFGVTDAALSYLSTRYVIITAEFRISGYLQTKGRQAINFNHFRPLWMN